MKRALYLSTFTIALAAAAAFYCYQGSNAQSVKSDDRQKPLGTQSCTPPAAGMVSWYRGENNANDARSGNGGSLQNGIGFTSGQVGQAFSFDGVDDFVSVSGHPTLDVGAGPGLTIETWIKPASIATQKPIVDWDAGATVGAHLWYSVTGVGGVTGNIYLNLIDTSGVNHVLQTPAVMTPGEFQHVAATYDKTSGVASIYRNGVEVATAVLGTFTPRTSTAFTLYLGTRPGTGIFYNGLLDETTIYDNPLTIAQVQDIYNAGAAGKCVTVCTGAPEGLVSWYRGENNGVDAAGTNDATLQNGTGYSGGAVGRGFDLDGVNDIVTAPDSPLLQFGTNSFTIETWARADSTNNYSSLFTKRLEGGSFTGINFFRDPAGFLGAHINSGSLAVVSSDAPMQLGQFYHLALVIDRDANIAKMYVNGVLQASQPSLAGVGSLSSPEPLRIGRVVNSVANPNPAQAFDGVIDELSIYNRALMTAEIQNIVNAGGSGKCPVCRSPPPNLNSWFPADINASDIQSGNTNGSLIGDASLTTDAIVGRAFSFDGSGDYLSVPDAPEQKPAEQLTVEGWFKFNTLGGGLPHLIAKPLRNSPFDSYAVWFDNGDLRIGYQEAGGSFVYYDTGFVPQSGVFYHFAYTLDTTDAGPTANTMKFFVNGVEVFSGVAGLPIYYNGINDALLPHPMLIGADLENNNPQFFLDGKADEVSLYGRTLGALEIRLIYDAQSAGKCHGACTAAPAGMVSIYHGENNVLDSRSRVDGTLTGGTTYTDGKVGQAFSFDGIDDGVDLGTSFSGSQFSVSMWVKPGTTQVPFANIIDNNHDCCTNWEIEQNGGNTNQYYFSGAGNFTLAASVWQHLVITYDAAGMARVYVDGAFVTGAAIPIPVSNPFLRLGRSACCGGRFWNGQMDEVAIFDRALSPVEVLAIHNAAAGICRPTAALSPPGQRVWLAGDGNALDSSGNSNNGTLTGGARFSVGKVGQAFDLDGVDDYVTVPDGPAVRPASALTVEGWFEFDSITGGSTANHLVAKPLGSSFGDSYVLWLGAGTIWVGVGDSPTTGDFIDTGYPVQTGVWYHIAMTFDDAANTVRCFVNGAQVGSFATNVTIAYDNHPLVIGSDITNETHNFFNDGREDEVSLYDRALTPREVRSIYDAGIAGRLKTVSSGNSMFSFWRGDGNANDSIGSNPGTLNGGTGFAAGAAGQSFLFDGVDDDVSAANAANLNFGPASPMSVELWAYRTSANAIQHILGKRSGCGASPANYQLAYASNQVFFGSFTGNEVGSGQDLPLNTWTHIAATFDGATFRIYINGALAGASSGTLGTPNSAPFIIGGSGTCARFGGQLDEIAMYDRALSPAEISSIYQTGGHLSSFAGDATVNFAGVTKAGEVQEIPLDPAVLPPLPMGVNPSGLTYDIATSAIYAGPLTVCFNVPSLTATAVNNLRIYHLENGAWVNRTAAGATYAALCTSGLSSLSPFAIAAVIPTAAAVSVSGRVVAGDGRGIGNARITLAGANGETRTALTGAFGYYRFDGLTAGETYIMTAGSKRYQFVNPTRVVTAFDDLTDVDFAALE